MVDRLQFNIEDYFNAAMDCVAGWYKRRSQIIIIVIASIVTLLLNADTITIANQLMTNPTLRAIGCGGCRILCARRICANDVRS